MPTATTTNRIVPSMEKCDHSFSQSPARSSSQALSSFPVTAPRKAQELSVLKKPVVSPDGDDVPSQLNAGNYNAPPHHSVHAARGGTNGKQHLIYLTCFQYDGEIIVKS